METTELNNDAYKIQWGDKELDEIKDGEGKIVWQSAYEKEKSGNGSVTFNGTRNRLVKSAVFEGESIQPPMPSWNLLNPAEVPNENKYVSPSTGELVTAGSTHYRHSGYVPVSEGVVYKFSLDYSVAYTVGMAWYDESKAYISGRSLSQIQAADGLLAAPTDAVYCRLSWRMDSEYNPDWQNTVYFYDHTDGDKPYAPFGQIIVPTPDTPLPILSNNSKWSGTGNNYVDLGDGWNLWDEEWEVGTISTTNGRPSSSDRQMRSKNFNKALPNLTYCMRNRAGMPLYVFWYDANYDFISAVSNTSSEFKTVVSPDNAHYFKVKEGTNSTPSATYNHDICINLSQPDNSKYPYNGVYRPYIEPVLGLNRIGTAVDTYDAQSGLLTRGIGVVDLGTLNWSYTASNSIFKGLISDLKAPASQADRLTGILCSKYPISSVATASSSMTDKSCMRYFSNINSSILVRDTSFTSAASFKAAMSGTLLYYELATPTTEMITPQPITQYRGQNSLTQIDGDIPNTKVTIEYYGKYND